VVGLDLPRRVVLLYGALSSCVAPDDLDSLRLVGEVGRVLEQFGIEVSALAMSGDLGTARRELERRDPELVFNLVESLDGLDRHAVRAFELLADLGRPYTGTEPAGAALSGSKLLAKRALRAAGLPTPPWAEDTAEGLGPIDFEGPYIVKSVWEQGSTGLDGRSVVATAHEARELLACRREILGGEGFVERYIDGRELNLSLLQTPSGLLVLPPAEMCFVGLPEGHPRIVDFAAKWDEDCTVFHATQRSFTFAEHEQAMVDRATALAEASFRALGLRGYGRVDLRVDADGGLWVLEANANPCITPDSGFVAACAQRGISYPEAIRRIVEVAWVGCYS
jgi:D-alanine-D-alanine ligase